MKNKINKFILLITFLLSIAPILAMGFYARPLWDDFTSTIYLHKFLTEGNLLFAIISPLFYSIATYLSWQGTYAAEIVFSLQPGAWPIPAYWLTTMFIVGGLSLSYVLLGQTISQHIFKSTKSNGTILALPLLILQFQYVPSIHQAFYWYNGSMYYGFFMALFVCEIALIIKAIYSGEEITKKSSFWIMALAFFISGGNYSTALVNCTLLIIWLILARLEQNMDKFRFLRKITIVAFIGLVISMIAPGNMVRAASTAKTGAVNAIIQSIIYALRCIKHWTSFQQVGMLLILIPIIYMIVKDTKVKFRYPILALLIMFGLFAAQATPPIYAMSYPGDLRQINMYYYSYYLLMAGCLFYLEGWFISKFDSIKLSAALCNIIALAGVALVVFGISQSGIQNTTAYQTYDDIASGRAKQYTVEYQNTIDQILSQDEICYVDDIKQQTNSLEGLSIKEDSEYWTNRDLASYFGKKKICLNN